MFGGIELAYFTANLTKLPQGGWLTVLIATVVFTVMTTWRAGHDVLNRRRIEYEGRLEDLLGSLRTSDPSDIPVTRVPGTAVFPHPTATTAPVASRICIDRYRAPHERAVIISGRTTDVPHLAWSQGLRIHHIGEPEDGIIHVAAEFGFRVPATQVMVVGVQGSPATSRSQS